MNMKAFSFSRIWHKHHLKWLLVILFTAAVIVVFNPFEAQHEDAVLVPVKPVNIPEGFILYSQPAKSIEVHLKGSRVVFKNMTKGKLEYLLDLSHVNSGEHSFPVVASQFNFPENLKIVSITPEILNLHIGKEAKRAFPIEIVFSGKPAANFQIVGKIARPASVILCGPEHILQSMERIPTKPVEINGVVDSFKKEISLDPPENTRFMQPPGIVVVEITIDEEVVTRLYEGIPVIGKDAFYPYDITPDTLALEIKGPLNILEEFQAEENITVSVDLKGLKPGVYVRRAAVTLPVETSLVSAKPEIFTVKIHDPDNAPE